MKNYVIGILAVIILILVSIIYRNEISTSPSNIFPLSKDSKSIKPEVEVPLLLYVFFSKKNCIDCLEIIETLNNLPPHFVVCGIIPEHELKEENELRRITGASFPLRSAAKYKKYIPWYTPVIMGVSPKGDIIFVLPGVPGEKEYLENFLDSLYNKIYPVFLNDKISE